MHFIQPILRLLPVLCITLHACGGAAEKKETYTQAAPPSGLPSDKTGVIGRESKAKPEIWLYANLVDRLNLREQPGKNAKVVKQLAEGDILEGTGEISSNKEDATLRGINYTEPYYKVTARTPDQPKGWAYGGALLAIYSGGRSSAPDYGKLSTFARQLKTLNPKQLSSGQKAWDFTQRLFARETGSTADAAYILLDNFFNTMEREGKFYEITEKMNWSNEDVNAIYEDRFDMTRNAQTRSFADNGFLLETAEGAVFPIPDYNRFSAFFVPRTSPAMRMYLEQSSKEIKDAAWSDGGIIISWDLLAERGIFWEKFNRDNPWFVLGERALESQRWITLSLINGADNTPVYDAESKAVLPEIKQLWANIIQKYPGTQLAAYTKEISELCAAEGWKVTEKVEKWRTEFVSRLGYH